MTLGMMASDVEQRIDFAALRRYKQERIQIQLREKDLGAVLCFDPDNVRYATSTTLGEWHRDKIRPGVRESEIVAEIYGWLLRNGCDRITGVNCVSGPRSNPHPHDFSDRMIRPGELVFIDIMSHFLGYGTCYYRTFVTTRATQKQKDLYKKAIDWLQASIDVVRPGITTSDIASQWPTAEEMGYPDELAAAGLCVGHGVGLSNHEKPFITRLLIDHPTPVQANMHFALETFAGDGEDGARIESQVIVTENGHKVITRWPCEELMVCSPR